MAINELEIFSQIELNNGGTVYPLEDNGIVKLVQFQDWYWYKNNRYGRNPVYQVFRAKDGKRLFVTTDFQSAYAAYESLTKLIKEDESDGQK